MDSKAGFIIKIERDDITSYADLSPLMHINTETLEDVRNDCKKIDTNSIFKDIDSTFNKTLFLKEKFLRFDFSKYTKFPSLQHAFSCLFSNYYRQKLYIQFHGKVCYQGLVSLSSNDNVVEIANDYEKRGFKKLKVKIGSLNDLEMENQILKEILNNTKEIKLRLDGNQKLSLSDYSYIFKNLDLSRIDYIEEPVAKKTELIEFYNTTKVPLAIDENIKIIRDIKIDGVKALVLKPTLTGDFNTIQKLVSNCAKRGISTIISSTYESQLGIYQLAELAHAINPLEHHGLDTFECFLENLLDLDVEQNMIKLKEEIQLKGPLYV